MNSTRLPAVAGTFYPGQAEELAREVASMLADAEDMKTGKLPVPKAIIAPHAGYIYSGPVAASVYACLKPLRSRIRRVVLLGPVHRVPVRGLALPGAGVESFATPLGTISIDRAAAQSIAHLPQVVESAPAHALEHSLEVHLPFLQTVLDDFMLLPLAVGDASPEQVAEVLELLWGGDETLIVVSSDLSHYLPHAAARATDTQTVQAILDRRTDLNHHQACGATPLNGLLLAAQRHGLTPKLLDLRNSGDTAGDKNRVVGYAAFALVTESATEALTKADTASEQNQIGFVLLSLARSAIARQFGINNMVVSNLPQLSELGATFVTLTQDGTLRGCIGSLEAQRPLAQDVQENAVAAAFRDPRFAPLTRDELDITRVEVSLLSPMRPLACSSEQDALSQMRPGIDGMVLQYRQQRGTFLPQVWEQLPQPQQFMAHLKRKAGLTEDFWSDEIRLARYTVMKWKEE